MVRRRIGEALEMFQEPKRIKSERGNRRDLPLDLTIEILSCLPAKTLVRFRRVCKLWLSVTHHAHFIETHLRKILARPPTLFLFPNYIYSFIFSGKITTTILDCCDDPSVRLNPKHMIRDVNLYASCNGLLCLSDSGTTLVVNPVTGESLTLPPSAHSCCMSSSITPYFGFEPVTKEYKVVRIFTDHKDALVCQVFTLGADTSWRQIHASLDFRTFGHYGVALKGAIYWQTSLSPWQGRDRDDRALRFNLKEECFDRITLPSFENFYRGRKYDIGREFRELKGSLCLPIFPDIVPGSNVSPRMDVWVMTSSSNLKQEWGIKYSIMFPWERRRQPMPLLIRNDKILVHDHQCGARLQYHDLRPNSNGGNNSFKHVYHQDKFYRVQFVHVESLVPLPS